VRIHLCKIFYNKFALLLPCYSISIFIEPVDEGTEQTLKLRLSTTLGEVKLPVYSNDTIGIAKKKLQVCIMLYV